MSSMLKKTGGLAFKPKVGRRPGAVSASASQSTTRAPTAESSQTPGPAPTTVATNTFAASVEPAPTQVSHELSQLIQPGKQTDSPEESPAPLTNPPKSIEPTPAITEQTTSDLPTSGNSRQNAPSSGSTPSADDTRAHGAERPPMTRTAPILTPVATSEIVHSTRPALSISPENVPSGAAVGHTLPQSTNESEASVPAANKEAARNSTDTATAAGLPTPASTATNAASQSSVAPSTGLPSPSLFSISENASATPPLDHPQGSGSAAASPAVEPPKKKRQYRRRQQPVEGEGAGPAGDATVPKPKRPRKRKAPAITEDQQGQAITNGEPTPEVPKRHFHRRQVTPDPESIPEDGRPDHTTTKIGDLTRDLGIGKKFKHADLILERQRQARHEAKLRKLEKQKRAMGMLSQADSLENGSRVGTPATENGGNPAAVAAVQSAQGPGIDFDIIDGQIMINQSSLVINQHAAEGDVQLETVEEDEFTHLTTSASYMRPSRIMGTNHWDDEDTEKFYTYLKMFGTDFETISHMFPDKNRRQIKLKFNREEKQRPNRVNAAITARGEKRVTIDLEHYKANRSGFDDNWITQDKFQAEQEQLRQGQEKELEAKRQERRDLGLLEDEPAKNNSIDKENGEAEQEEIEEELIDDQDVGATATIAA